MKPPNIIVTIGFTAVTMWINAVPTTASGAEAGEATSVEELRLIIEQQQRQLKAQAKTLEALKQQVDKLEKTAVKEPEEPVPTTAAKERVNVVERDIERISLSVSGQVNRGVLFADDGEDQEWFHVDNDSSSTRIRLLGKGQITENFSVGTQVEVQFESNSTFDVNQRNRRNVGPNSFTERKLELYLDSKRLGRLWIGQGDTASNGTSEVDLSGTALVGYSGVSDTAGGILFRNSETGALTDLSIGDVFSNFDGLSRDDRLRYDTPTFEGFEASTSWAAADRWDAALRFGGNIGPTKIAAAVAYSDLSSDTIDHTVNGSVSVLHDSGLNITFAAADQDRSGRDPAFWYVKLGYLADFSPWGKTAFAIDYAEADEVAAIGDKFRAYGAFAVQKLDDYGTEFYLGLRNHEFDRSDLPTDDIFAALAGARVKF